MKKTKPNQNPGEVGITLIALIITIILLVIISAVTIQSLTGHQGLIEGTEIAKENYNIESYKEQIQQIAQAEIIVQTAKGEETTIDYIKQALDKQPWVKQTKKTENRTKHNNTSRPRIHIPATIQ